MSIRHLKSLLAIGVGCVAWACSDAVSPQGNASLQDRADVMAVLNESGFFADDFGNEGIPDGASTSAAAAVVAAEGEAPHLWGRFRGRPVNHEVTIDIDKETGIATVSKRIDFEGKFLVDVTDDGELNPVEKPIRETLVQQAVLEHLEPETLTDEKHPWRLIAISPAEWVMTDPEARSVDITSVTIDVNGAIVLEITDPQALLDVAADIPVLQAGDEVTITASVANGNPENVSPTFVFLHVLDAGSTVPTWNRIEMAAVETESGNTYTASWTVEQALKGRLSVDAIDAATLTQAEVEYRANSWGIPYHGDLQTMALR